MSARAREQRDTDGGAGPILEAAALLEVKEFDLFARAHRWWFGRRLDRKALERVFAAYAARAPPIWHGSGSSGRPRGRARRLSASASWPRPWSSSRSLSR